MPSALPAWSRPNCMAAAMASFVKATYDLAKNRELQLTPEHGLQPFHYRLKWIIDDQAENEAEDEDEEEEDDDDDDDDSSDEDEDDDDSSDEAEDEDEERQHHIVGAVFEWKKDAPVPRPAAAPEVVVAFRGTNPEDPCDLADDIFLLMMGLHTTPRYNVALGVIERVIKKHGVRNACVTGHSLGAAICLLAGRDLAQRGLYIHAHVFNPPFPSLLAYHNGMLNFVHRAVVEIIAALLHDKAERLKNTQDAFLALKHWRPHLYVNANDRICSAYIAYFNKSRVGDIVLSGIAGMLAPRLASSQELSRVRGQPHCLRALIGTILRDTPGSHPFHLIPCAHLHIADPEEPDHESHHRTRNLKQWVIHASKAHGIKQWLSPHVDIHSRQVQLV